MELVNATLLATAYTVALDASGREHLVVVAKGTFDFPGAGEDTTKLAEEQVPVLLADELGGESGALPVCEADLCFRKAKCDVLLNCAAHAPEGVPATRVQVGVRIGRWTKSFIVHGDRLWSSIGMTRPTRARPFTVMPISYERAFGGARSAGRDAGTATYLRNPIGRGYLPGIDPDGHLVPNTEAVDNAVTSPTADYMPMSFGPVGRSWYPRYTYAGTFDERWREEVYPFLPPDFSESYYQAAPEDQQIDYPDGGEEVTLLNLSPEGRLSFHLPRAQATMTVAPRHQDREPMNPVLDTIVIEPTERRLTLSWRASRPLRRSIFEIDEVVVGSVSARFHADRDGLPLPHPLSVEPSTRAGGADQ